MLGLIALPLAVSVATAAPGQAAEAGDDPVAAFAEAGYSFADAQVLAARWGVADPDDVKTEAGGWLLTGAPLTTSPRADQAADDQYTDGELRQVFADFGYTVDEAGVLASQWGVALDEAKARGGSEIKVVGVLPFVDPPVDEGRDQIEAFARAGYTLADAEVLAARWGVDDTTAVKVKAGGWLKTEGRLAGSPWADPAADDGLGPRELRRVFREQGYTLDDARVLAAEWETTVRGATTQAGSELLVVGVLPFVDPPTGC
jgi:hypothetical protein